MGSTCGSTRRELRFCHRCPRGFSSCKVVVKGFRSFFFFSRLYHPLPRPFSADITCRLFPFARVLPFMLVCTFSLASRFLFASTLFFRFFFSLAFFHFLPANLSCLLVLCSSTRIAFTPRSVIENISHSSWLFSCCSIYKNDLSAASSSNIFLFKSCWHGVKSSRRILKSDWGKYQ